MRSKSNWRDASVVLAIRELQKDRAAAAQARANLTLKEADIAVSRLETMRAKARAEWELATCTGSKLDPLKYAGFSQGFERFDRTSAEAKETAVNAKMAQEKCRESTQSSYLLLDLARQTNKLATCYRQRTLEERQWNTFEESARAGGFIK